MKHSVLLVSLVVCMSKGVLGNWTLAKFTNSSGLQIQSVWHYDSKLEQKDLTGLTNLVSGALATSEKNYFLEHPVTSQSGIGFSLLDNRLNQIVYVYCDGQYDHAIAAGRVSAKIIKTVIAKPNGTYYARAVVKNSKGEPLHTSTLAIAPEKESCNLTLSNVKGGYVVQLDKAL